MIPYLSRLMLSLSGLFLVFIMLIHSQEYTAANLDNVFQSDDCLLPCAFGIMPGTTQYDDAKDVIANSEWTSKMRVIDYRQSHYSNYAEWSLIWTWNVNRPIYIDDSRHGTIFVNRSELLDPPLVERIVLPTQLRMDAFRQWLGPPASTEAFIDNEGLLKYSIIYPDVHIMVSTYLDCPARLLDYWNGRAELTLSTQLAIRPLISVQDAVRLC